MCNGEERPRVDPDPPPVPERAAEGAGSPIIPAGEGACVWMQAGVVAYWLCDRHYRCEDCALDGALRHLQARGASEADTGTAPALEPRLPSDAPGLAARAPSPAGLGGLDLDLPDLDPALRYHAAHTWARLESPARARIGVDPFAAHIVGPLRSVILLHRGAHVRRGHACAWLDHEGGTLTVLAPLSGVILECNAAAVARPDVVCGDPLGGGWLLCLQPTELDAELHRLQGARAFRRRVQRDAEVWRREVRRAMRRASPAVGHTMADGGVRVTDVGQLIGARRRHEIAAHFLGAPWVRTWTFPPDV